MSRFLKEKYITDRVLWRVSEKERWVRWKDHGHTGDTLERIDDIDDDKLDAFSALDPEVLQGVAYVREAIYNRLASNKIAERRPVYNHTFTVDELRFPTIARTVLEYLADEAGVTLEEDEETGNLSLDTKGSLDVISKVSAMHLIRKGNAFGLLRIRCGAAGFTDLMGLSDLMLQFSVPKDNPAAYSRYKFSVMVTTVVRNGLTGMGEWPKIPMPTDDDPDAEDERYGQDEKTEITQHFKAELAQRWHPAAIAHPLREGGWASLPAGTEALAVSVAIPGPRKRRAAAEVELDKARKAARAAAREAKAEAQPPPKAWTSRSERAKMHAERRV